MSKTIVNIELNLTAFKNLAAYLERHETDIALDINDFGDLHDVYVVVFEDEPKKI